MVGIDPDEKLYLNLEAFPVGCGTVLQATNAGARRPGYEASRSKVYLISPTRDGGKSMYMTIKNTHIPRQYR